MESVCIFVPYLTTNKMKKFDFRRQLKGMNLEELKDFRNYHIDWMLKFMAVGCDKEADKHSRYVSYIDVAIQKQVPK